MAETNGLASSEACRENRPDDEPSTPRRDHQGMAVRSQHWNPLRVTMSVTVSPREDSARAVAPTVAIEKAGVPSAHVNCCRAGCFEANWDPQRRPAQIRDRFEGAYSVRKLSPRIKRPPARASSTTSSVRDLHPRPRELVESQHHDGAQTPPSAIAEVLETAIVVKTCPRHRWGEVHAAESRRSSKPQTQVVRSEGRFYLTRPTVTLTRSVSEERNTSPRLHVGLVCRSDKCVTAGRVRYQFRLTVRSGVRGREV